MKIGTPAWWSPPHVPAGSTVPRPATTAPGVVSPPPCPGGPARATPSHDRAGGEHLVDDLLVDAGDLRDPLVEPEAAVAEAVVDALVRARDEAVEGHGHV